MEGCVDGAYFGRSPNGWISTELFYGHFAKHVTERPLVLLVNGHSSHIDLEVSKFCIDQRINLYYLLPHTPHITNLLMLAFMVPWRLHGERCVRNTKSLTQVSHSPSTLLRIFNDAWVDCVKMSTFVRLVLSQSGMRPLNRHVMKQSSHHR